MHTLLLRALEHIRFEPNELVYLALSSKVERPVVDRLAWRLHRDGKLMAAREWRRTDLALFEPGQEGPVALLEAKAFSSFASVRQPDKYPDEISRDIEKAVELRAQLPTEPEIFVLAVMTHPVESAPNALRELVKYPFWFREPVKLEQAKDCVREFLEPRGPVGQVTLQTGRAWNVPVCVFGWLCGPIGESPPADSQGSRPHRGSG